MPNNNEFTVILDKRQAIELPGLTIPETILMGMPFYKESPTGLADSIEAVVDGGLIHVPTYALISGRQFAGLDNKVWSQYQDSKAEKLTLLDEQGIMGAKGIVYAVDIQNGGLFVWNPQRIREAVQGGNLVDYALQLSQEEVNGFLDAVKRKDYKALNEIVHGRNFAFAGGYDAFVEASANPGFIDGMETTYAVIRTAEDARKIQSGYQTPAVQKENPDIIIASGGKEQAAKMIDQAESFTWEQLGSWHDGYTNLNTGRVVFLGSDNDGVIGDAIVNGNGWSVGVVPEALVVFHHLKDYYNHQKFISSQYERARAILQGWITPPPVSKQPTSPIASTT